MKKERILGIVALLGINTIIITLQILLTDFLLKIPEEVAYKNLCYSFPIFESFHQSVASFVIIMIIIISSVITLFATIYIISGVKKIGKEIREPNRIRKEVAIALAEFVSEREAKLQETKKEIISEMGG